ncbi:MAG: nicotinamide riboside transporter PnuC [Saprospiraceae bacterium]
MSFFSIENTFFNILNYPVSYIEFIGSMAGIIAVWLAAKSQILTWPIGLINITLFFIIFWQVELYSDVFLQVYFFTISIYGWYNWHYENQHQLPIKTLSQTLRIKYSMIIIISSVILGLIVSNLNIYMPKIFVKPAAYPFLDSFVAVTSVIANTFMARRILENWLLWIIVNIVCVGLYFSKNIIFVSIEYFIFLLLAILGHFSWTKEKNISINNLSQ